MGKKDNEFVVRYNNKHIMDKLEILDTKIGKTYGAIAAVDKKVAVTNGTVKLHTKIIWSLGGAVIMLAGWIFFIIR